jgi:hypothetical protein
MQDAAIEMAPGAIEATDPPAASIPVIPILTCIAAGLALAFTPVVVWRMTTGSWVSLQQPETLYYLQIAAQAYYNHLWYISDPAVADGVSFYPWIQFVPFVVLVRSLGLSISSVPLFWSFCAGAGMGAGLYLVFWRALRRAWLAAGLTIVCLSDFGFCGPYVIFSQLKSLASALLIHRHRILLSNPLVQWRVPDPSLDLPWLFLQFVAVSIARERPQRLNLWISGVIFGLSFYVFFFLWTMVAAGLLIAMLLDRAGRKVYRWTLLIGVAIGWPELALSMHLRALATAEGAARLGVFVHTSRIAHLDFPVWSVAIAILIGLWIRRTGRFDLIFPLSLLIAGILLGESRLITGTFFHEDHYAWLWWPIRLILLSIVSAAFAERYIPRRPLYVMAFSAFAILYLASAIYLSMIDVTRTSFSNRQRQDFVRYRTQRMAPGAARLAPRSVIAGAENFGALAVVGEDQRMLAGWSLPLSVAVNDATWESRVALNAFLTGVQHSEFARMTSEDVLEYWFLPIQPQLKAGFKLKFDEATRDPDKFIRAFGVRYVALPSDQPPPAYVASRFRLLQPGPYWQIWQIQ